MLEPCRACVALHKICCTAIAQKLGWLEGVLWLRILNLVNLEDLGDLVDLVVVWVEEPVAA